MADSKSQDAIALLKQDHRTVEELFEKFEKASGDGRKQQIAEQICLELSVHAQIEEEIFYPACEGKVEEDLLKESYVEHDGAKVLIAEILAGGPKADEYYDAKVKVLSEEIEHHVEEEEKACSHRPRRPASTWTRSGSSSRLANPSSPNSSRRAAFPSRR